MHADQTWINAQPGSLPRFHFNRSISPTPRPSLHRSLCLKPHLRWEEAACSNNDLNLFPTVRGGRLQSRKLQVSKETWKSHVRQPDGIKVSQKNQTRRKSAVCLRLEESCSREIPLNISKRSNPDLIVIKSRRFSKPQMSQWIIDAFYFENFPSFSPSLPFSAPASSRSLSIHYIHKCSTSLIHLAAVGFHCGRTRSRPFLRQEVRWTFWCWAARTVNAAEPNTSVNRDVLQQLLSETLIRRKSAREQRNVAEMLSFLPRPRSVATLGEFHSSALR